MNPFPHRLSIGDDESCDISTLQGSRGVPLSAEKKRKKEERYVPFMSEMERRGCGPALINN